MAKMALITTLDEFEAEYRAGIGHVLPPGGSREASIDNIRRFGDGVGDYNPFYRDPAYAAKARFGMITAPPIFIYGASLGIALAINGGIDRRRLSSSYFPMNYAGGAIDFHRTIWPGDRLRATERVVDVHRKHSARIGDFVLCEAAIEYRNQRQELVASKTTLMARYQNLGGGGRYDAEHARHRRNMPGQFDWGPQRVCWLAQMATDWMGDDGTLKRMETRVRHPNVVGDTNTVFGKVAAKRTVGAENGTEHLVDLEVYNENQAGLATAESRITVALPARSA